MLVLWISRRGLHDAGFPRLWDSTAKDQSTQGKTRKQHMLPRGFWRLLVPNIKELEALSSCRRSYCSETAHSFLCKNRKATGERAAQPALSPRLLSLGSGQSSWAHFLCGKWNLDRSGGRKKDMDMGSVCVEVGNILFPQNVLVKLRDGWPDAIFRRPSF